MDKVGLVAGGGALPIEFVRSARRQGDQVVVFAINKMASPELDGEADIIYWLGTGQYAKFVLLLLKERIRKIALVGKVDKSVIYRGNELDDVSRKALKGVRDKKDYSILEEATRRLNQLGVEVIDGMKYLSHLLPEKGLLGEATPDGRIEEDVKFGYEAAKKLSGMDIGQTVIVKDKAIVAVEAMEGTDPTIDRAGAIAGKGCVMVKVSRPDQDMRWDVPTVGPETMDRLVKNEFSAVAIESGKMFLVEREKFIKMADKNGIVAQAL
jgi:DUF1009 family protein